MFVVLVLRTWLFPVHNIDWVKGFQRNKTCPYVYRQFCWQLFIKLNKSTLLHQNFKDLHWQWHSYSSIRHLHSFSSCASENWGQEVSISFDEIGWPYNLHRKCKRSKNAKLQSLTSLPSLSNMLLTKGHESGGIRPLHGSNKVKYVDY